MSPALPEILKVTVVLMVLAIGLGATPKDATFLLHRLRLLLRSVIAMYVLVPLVALLVTRLVPLVPGVRAALLVLAVSAGAPLLPRKLNHVGDAVYSFSLVLLTSALAIVVVPAWIVWLGPQFDVLQGVSPMRVARRLAASLFAPLAVGMALRPLLAARADRVVASLARVGGIVLIAAAVAMIATHGSVLLAAHRAGVGALGGVIVGALAVGHLLGGQAPGNRAALAVACATRHIGIAVLVASTLPGPPDAVLVALYVMTSTVVSLPYLVWSRRLPVMAAAPGAARES